MYLKILLIHNSEHWADWLASVVDRTLNPYEAKPDFPSAARQFLLRWNFYRYKIQKSVLAGKKNFSVKHEKETLFHSVIIFVNDIINVYMSVGHAK